jgi:predicted N-acetyltransferase YhbS
MPRMNNVRIEYLSDNILYAETAAGWIYNEFIKGIKTDRTYESVVSAFKNCHKTELPVRLVALLDNTCAGTISIVHNDLKRRDYTPWLASLYVDKPYRGNKIAQQLIERVKNIASEMGYAEIYLRTEHASDYYRRLDWQFIESCEDDYDLKPDVFKAALS